jgi:hypothetical protein
LLCDNSIPTTFEPGEYPTLIVGENARTVPAERLRNGGFLDATAAMILQSRGIDTGILSSEKGSFLEEKYLQQKDAVPNVDCEGLRKIRCSEKVTVLSQFEDGSPASYTYENEDGYRFYVLAMDHFFVDHKGAPRRNFFNNYYRQEEMMNAVEWMCGKPLPVTCKKNPGLYIYTAKSETAMSVLLLNIHMDSIEQPVVELDGAYRKIRTVNCTAVLEGNKVTLSELHPYSMAAFEVQ